MEVFPSYSGTSVRLQTLIGTNMDIASGLRLIVSLYLLAVVMALALRLITNLPLPKERRLVWWISPFMTLGLMSYPCIEWSMVSPSPMTDLIVCEVAIIIGTSVGTRMGYGITRLVDGFREFKKTEENRRSANQQ